MAEEPRSLEFLLSCQVCFEEFEEDGDHIPRLLLCSHTVCESCIKQLIKNKKLDCPECRAKHNAGKQEKNFPQNKYLLVQVKRGGMGVKENNSEKCGKHGKELNLFCREPECQKHIWVSCMKQHRKHDVLDTHENIKDDIDLLDDVEALRKNLQIQIQTGMK